MNAGTPREHDGLPLVRTTDYARVLLWQAQVVLAMLAVPVAITVGVVAGLLAPDYGAVHGVLAGVGTVSGCWLLLAGAVACWRRLLARRDLRNWADDWARVEPLWSDRIS